jgi:hypothetical protein
LHNFFVIAGCLPLLTAAAATLAATNAIFSWILINTDSTLLFASLIAGCLPLLTAAAATLAAALQPPAPQQQQQQQQLYEPALLPPLPVQPANRAMQLLAMSLLRVFEQLATHVFARLLKSPLEGTQLELVPIVRLALAAVYSLQASPAAAATLDSAAAATCNAAASSSSVDAGKGRELSDSDVQQQLLLAALDVTVALAAAVQEEVVEVAEAAEDEESTRVLIGPFVTKLVVSADFLTLLLVYLAAVAKHWHGQQRGLSQVTAAAAFVAAYGKRSEWRQQQQLLQQLRQQQQQDAEQQQQQQAEDVLAVPDWHQQIMSGLGLRNVDLPDHLQSDQSDHGCGISPVSWILVAQTLDALLQIRCKLAKADQQIAKQWVVDQYLPNSTAAAAVAENRAMQLQPPRTATAAPNSSSSSSSVMHVRCPMIQQQLVLPLLLTMLELQALQPTDGVIFGLMPAMITALEIWLDVERKLDGKPMEEQPWGTCDTAMAAVAASQLLPQLLHVLGPAVLCVDRGLDEESDRALGVQATRVYGRVVFSVAKAGEISSSSSRQSNR